MALLHGAGECVEYLPGKDRRRIGNDSTLVEAQLNRCCQGGRERHLKCTAVVVCKCGAEEAARVVLDQGASRPLTVDGAAGKGIERFEGSRRSDLKGGPTTGVNVVRAAD